MPFDPSPWVIARRSGSLVVAQRGVDVVTRNVSLFKRFHCSEGPQVDVEVHASGDDLSSIDNGEDNEEWCTDERVGIPPVSLSADVPPNDTFPSASTGPPGEAAEAQTAGVKIRPSVDPGGTRCEHQATRTLKASGPGSRGLEMGWGRLRSPEDTMRASSRGVLWSN
ncbi:hypothetical protein NDU88_004483 [Pleurodeles waltl]|uniref:Uncharacterized protein n=1 Tax=Pleurodeles waltl TaxID=8319 RepID=A0AAV7T7X1_PLEWA|nr:hypothetical protein NDU88_004483 [Pleurodeles waltl]